MARTWLVVTLIGWSWVMARAQAQDAGPPSASDDACDRGWQLYLAHDPNAADVLDHAIAALGTPRTPVLRRRLGACLYSRGRVAEDASPSTAIPYYVRSVALRPNATAQARLDALRVQFTASWTERERHTPDTLGPIDAALTRVLASAADGAGLLLRWADGANDEITVVVGGDDAVYVLARRAGGAWAVVNATHGTCLDGAHSDAAARLDEPEMGGVATIVLTRTCDSRHVGSDGDPDWGTFVVTITVAIDVSWGPRIASTEEGRFQAE